MSNVFTLDAIREEAKKKYENVVIGLSDDVTVELKPLLRLGKTARDAVKDAVEEMGDLPEIDEDDEDAEELIDEAASKACDIIAKVFRLIAVAPRKLLAELDAEQDPKIRSEIYTAVLKLWMRETQLGEASSSPS
jgi:hypothetical protein